MAEDGGEDERDDAEDAHGVRRFLHAVVHGRDVLADVDGLDRAVFVLDFFRRHHDARFLPVVVLAAIDGDFVLLPVPFADEVEDERLDAERGARKVQQPSVLVKDVEEQAVIRTLVARVVEREVGMLVEIDLRLGDAAGRIEEFPRLLGRDRPLHRLVHDEDQQHKEDSHDGRVEQREAAASLAKDVRDVCGHQDFAASDSVFGSGASASSL